MHWNYVIVYEPLIKSRLQAIARIGLGPSLSIGAGTRPSPEASIQKYSINLIEHNLKNEKKKELDEITYIYVKLIKFTKIYWVFFDLLPFKCNYLSINKYLKLYKIAMSLYN